MPIFSQDWFLDTLGHWEVVLSYKGDKVVGALPYPIQQKMGLSFSITPTLCMYLGAYIIPEYRTVNGQHEILRDLIQQLPTFAHFNHKFNYHITNWLPFYWKGYKQTTRYSYILENLSHLDEVYQNFYGSYRNSKIPKAQQHFEIRTDLSLETFYAINKLTYDRQKIAVPFSYPYLEQIHQALVEKKQGKMFFAVNENGTVCSVLYLIWDNQRAYAWLSGDDPTHRNSGSGILTYWASIQFAAKELNLPIYDFAGSMLENVEKVRRSFGAKQVPYFQIWKYKNSIIELGMKLLGK